MKRKGMSNAEIKAYAIPKVKKMLQKEETPETKWSPFRRAAALAREHGETTED